MAFVERKTIEIDPNDPKDVAMVLSKYVNNMSHSAKELAEELHNDHRTLIQCTANVFIKFFELLANDYCNNRYDARDEAACKLAMKIMNSTNECDRSFPFI